MSASSSSASSSVSSLRRAWAAYKARRRDVCRLQGGTGKHLDGDVARGPVDEGGRPFQAQVVLRSQVEGDGSLQVVPGFHWHASDFFRRAGGPVPPGEFYALRPEYHADIIDDERLWWYVRRVPDAWRPEAHGNPPPRTRSCAGTARACRAFADELRALPLSPLPQEGDYILWDPRLVHSTGEEGELNRSTQVRQTFYCAYRPASASTRFLAQEQLAFRAAGTHPAWGADSHRSVEEEEEGRAELDDLGAKLYGEKPWVRKLSSGERLARREARREAEASSGGIYQAAAVVAVAAAEDMHHHNHPTGTDAAVAASATTLLTPRLLAFFKRYGFVVVPNVVPAHKTAALRAQIADFVKRRYAVDMASDASLRSTLSSLTQLKRMVSSYGAGMVELFWLPAMDHIRTDPDVYGVFSALLKGTWATHRKPFQNNADLEHPDRLLIYADRTNVRFPTDILEEALIGPRPDGPEPDKVETVLVDEEQEEKAEQDVAREMASARCAETRKRKRANGGGGDAKRSRRDIDCGWIPNQSDHAAITTAHAQLFDSGAGWAQTRPGFLAALERKLRWARDDLLRGGWGRQRTYSLGTDWLRQRKHLWRQGLACRQLVRKLQSLRRDEAAAAAAAAATTTEPLSLAWLETRKELWHQWRITRALLKGCSALPGSSALASLDVGRLANILDFALCEDAGASRLPSLRSVVLEYYNKVNPEHVKHVDAVLAQFAGREAEMARRMQTKYGVGLWDVASARAQEARNRAEVADVLFRLVGEVMSRSRDERRSKQGRHQLCHDDDDEAAAVAEEEQEEEEDGNENDDWNDY